MFTKAGRLLLLVVLVAMIVACPAEQAAAKTDIAVDGSTVTLSVAIDLIGAIGLSGKPVKIEDDSGVPRDFGDYWGGAAKLWNDAFAKYSYKGCVNFKLDLQFFPLPYNATRTPGHHAVLIDPNPDVRARVFDPTTNDATADTPGAFTMDLQGVWGVEDAAIISHEVGHLLGLGDDYVDVKDANGKVTGSTPLPGRENTQMARSHSENVDQALIDRIGKQVEDSGKKLPTCWTGTMTLSGYSTDPGGHVCTDPSTDFSIKFATASDGAVQGDGSFRGAQTSCEGLFGPLVQDQTDGTFTIAGRREGDEFNLGITYPFTNNLVFAGYWPDNAEMKWSVPIQGAEVHAVISSTLIVGTYPGQVTLKVDLRCTGCEPGP